MIVPHSQTRALEIYIPIPPKFSSLRLRHQPVTQNRMSLKWNVAQKIISIEMECYSKWHVPQNGMSLTMECHSKWNVNKNGISLNMKCHSNWNNTQN